MLDKTHRNIKPKNKKFQIELSTIASQIRNKSIDLWGAERELEILGLSPAIQDVLKKIKKIAPFSEPVLITGESGVGKELMMRAIYLLGNRSGKALVSVNCPQYQEGNLTVSELFGHKKGSFTGAHIDHKGAFENANQGILFLDEIADLHMSAQVMLLRALAEGEYKSLGSNQSHRVDTRVIAATNRPLDQLMVTNEFRNDLYFRLNYFHIQIPPLRKRDEDWNLLIHYFLSKLKQKYGIEKYFSDAAINLLSSYDWPGNIRELNSLVTRGYAYSDGKVIEPRDFAVVLGAQKIETCKEFPKLHSQMVVEGECFWDVVHKPYMRRDLNRSQVKSIIAMGLAESNNNYRLLLQLFNVPDCDYQKFMDFLRHHNLKP